LLKETRGERTERWSVVGGGEKKKASLRSEKREGEK